MGRPPPTFDQIPHILVSHTDALTLVKLRQVNRTLHRLSNESLAELFKSLIKAHRKDLGFPKGGFAVYNGILYRGDTRPPAQIFSLGFTKRNLETPHISGEKVKNVISTSKDPNTVRRKYTEIGGYLYALYGAPGLDTHDFNKLDEVATLFVPPECVIGAIGPIVGEDDERYQLIVGVHEAHINQHCTQTAEIIDQARQVLLQLCHA